LRLNGNGTTPSQQPEPHSGAAPLSPVFVGQEQILATPSVEAAIDLMKDCVATRAIGVITGGNGTGKTFALKAIAGRYSKLGLPGTCLSYRCCQVNGSTRGVKDLLTELGARGGIFQNGASATLQLLVKYALHELTKKDIHTLLLDEADLWDREALGGLVTLYDFCREKDFPIALILSGTKELNDWIGGVSAGISRTLGFHRFSSLSLKILSAVLQEWGAPFRSFIEAAKKGDPEAKRNLQLIHKHSGGNMRRLRFFTDLFLLHEPSGAVSREAISRTFNKMLQSAQKADEGST
jgi:hypothetical protein